MLSDRQRHLVGARPPPEVLMHLMALRAFRRAATRTPSSPSAWCLNAPYGAPCFPTKTSKLAFNGFIVCLNAPYGAPCFPTAQRVVPAVTRGDDTLDRRGPKKHESDPQAQRQISSLFVAIRRIAADGQQHSSRPGNSRSHRRVVPLHTCTTPHAKQPTNCTQARMPPRAAPSLAQRDRGQPRSSAQLAPAS